MSRSSFPRRLGLWLLCGLFSLSLLQAQDPPPGVPRAPRPTVLQQTPELMEELTEEVLKQGIFLVNQRKFPEAVPFLNEVAFRLRTTDDPRQKRQLEFAYYYLGMGYMEMEKFDETVGVLQEYATRFPQGQYIRQAILVWADALASLENWAEAEKVLWRLIKEHHLEPFVDVAAHQLLGESLVQQQKWEDAIPSLLRVFQRSPDRDIRAKAGGMAATCYIRLDRFQDLYRFLPYVLRTPARYDIEFNLALIEAGDRNLVNDKYPEALILYRLVYFKADLLANLERETERVKNLRMLILRDMVDVPEKLSQLKRTLQTLARHREMLNDYPDYDQEVTIRLARAYLNLRRHWEALLLFRDVYDRSPQHPLADQALYSAVATAGEMPQEERALAEGYEYVRAFPGGDYWDEVTLMMAQLHVKRQEYQLAIDIIKKALEVTPEHGYIDHMFFLMGYCLFHTERFDEALIQFDELRQQYPDSAFREPCDYWHAMAQLFKKEYKLAKIEFSEFTQRYIGGEYYEDASFRTGVAQYGEGEFEDAAGTFQSFIDRFPTSRLKAEAYIMLGDVKASWGDLDNALADFAAVETCTTNMVYINYAALRSGKVYELEQRWDEIIEFFTAYLSRWGQQGAFTEATYYIGTSQLKLGRNAEAYQTFLGAINDFGNVPQHYGIDMIVRDLVEQLRTSAGSEQRKEIATKLAGMLQRARSAKQQTLELRLLAAQALMAPAGPERAGLVHPLLSIELLPVAAPITLNLIAEEAAAQGKTDLARQAYDRLLTKYRESDFALDALKGQAELEFKAQRVDLARQLLEEIVNRFATTPDAGEAQLRIGDTYRNQRKYKEAIEAYNTVLTVKEWKGPMWPQALYAIADCYLEQGSVREAFAFFQRVYVLYDAYVEWAAKGYLKSAECLRKLNLRADAVSTYREMLADERIAGRPEGEIARRELAQLEDR